MHRLQPNRVWQRSQSILPFLRPTLGSGIAVLVAYDEESSASERPILPWSRRNDAALSIASGQPPNSVRSSSRVV